jgi:hypothetical protein
MKYPASHLTPFLPAFSREIVRKENRTRDKPHRALPFPLSTFRMNTCKSVSKQRTLSTSRMNTYAKTGGGGLIPPRGSSGFVYPESLFAPAHPSDPLFSDTYKSLAAQTLSFHIHTKPPGCHPALDSKAFSVLSVSSVLSVLNSFLHPFSISI